MQYAYRNKQKKYQDSWICMKKLRFLSETVLCDPTGLEYVLNTLALLALKATKRSGGGGVRMRPHKLNTDAIAGVAR